MNLDRLEARLGQWFWFLTWVVLVAAWCLGLLAFTWLVDWPAGRTLLQVGLLIATYKLGLRHGRNERRDWTPPKL